jgi:hypothetical protein
MPLHDRGHASVDFWFGAKRTRAPTRTPRQRQKRSSRRLTIVGIRGLISQFDARAERIFERCDAAVNTPIGKLLDVLNYAICFALNY